MKFVLRFSGLLVGATLSAVAQPASPERSAAVLQAVASHTAKLERVAPDKAKLSLTPKLAGGGSFKLYDAAGKEVSLEVLRDGTIEAVVDPQRPYVLSRPAPRQTLPAAGLQFPARYVTNLNPGAGTVNLGGLFLRPARVPLTWDGTAKAYTTELLVGYEFQDGSEKALGIPKTIGFFAEGTNAKIEADTVTVKQSGVSGYQRVKISTTEIGRETLFTARAGPVDELKSSVAVRREPGALKLSLPSSEIVAFGVGTGTLSVSLLARDGLSFAAEQAQEIQLTSRRLRLPATVTLPAGKSSVEIAFRSMGIGADEIAVQAGTLTAAQAVQLSLPLAAIVAAVGGGALGGVARYFRNRRRATKQNALLVRRLVEGILVGVIFVGAAWAGVVAANLSTGVFSTPFGAFVLAALSGYVGCAVLDRVTNKNLKALSVES